MQRLIVVLASVVLLIAGSTLVSSATSDDDSPGKRAPRLAAEGVRQVPISARDIGRRNPVVQRVYTPLAAPCRLYSSTSTSPFGATTQRTIPLTACPAIPFYATALDATLTAAEPQRAGRMRVWADGATEPKLTPLYYAGTSVATGATVPMSSSGLRARNYTGVTDLIIDVTGYYAEPLYVDVLTASTTAFADVYSSTSMVSGYSSALGSPGQIVVSFRRDVSYCDIQATAETTSYSANAVMYNSNSVVVTVTNASGTPVRAYASVLVTC